jgi:hypothetical protein
MLDSKYHAILMEEVYKAWARQVKAAAAGVKA